MKGRSLRVAVVRLKNSLLVIMMMWWWRCVGCLRGLGSVLLGQSFLYLALLILWASMNYSKL